MAKKRVQRTSFVSLHNEQKKEAEENGSFSSAQRVDKVDTLRKNGSIFSGGYTALPALAALAQSAP